MERVESSYIKFHLLQEQRELLTEGPDYKHFKYSGENTEFMIKLCRGPSYKSHPSYITITSSNKRSHHIQATVNIDT